MAAVIIGCRDRTAVNRVDILRGAGVGAAEIELLVAGRRIVAPADLGRPVTQRRAVRVSDRGVRRKRQGIQVGCVVIAVQILRLRERIRTVDVGCGVGVIVELRRAGEHRVQRQVV